MLLIPGKCAFLCIPKCGTTWIQTLCAENRLGAVQVGGKHGAGRVADVPHFTAVRNPRRWLPSIYEQWKIGPIYFAEGLWHESPNGDFTSFVKHYLRYPGIIGRTFSIYTDCADVVGDRATLTDDVCDFLEACGVERPKTLSPPQNVTKSLPEWPEGLFDRLRESEHTLFQLHPDWK